MTSFVIQEHHATALHWDFRLERDGVLVSWAVPKGVPTDPKVNRLAVRVEDHALEHAHYEGTIGHGRYGAGAVTIWDSGSYVAEKWTDREIKFVLTGRRVQGRFVLFHTGGQNWMMHRMDGPPRPDWQPLPTHVTPMEAVDGALPRGSGWAFEFAWPGVRAIARTEGGRVGLATAGGTDASSLFPELRALAEPLGTTQALLDGALVRFGPGGWAGGEGVEAVRARMAAGPTRARALAKSAPVVYLIFDLLHLDGRSLLDTPYRERRQLLDGLALDDPAAPVPPVLTGAGRDAVRLAREQGLAGVIAKQVTSTYRPGEASPDWLAVRV